MQPWRRRSLSSLSTTRHHGDAWGVNGDAQPDFRVADTKRKEDAITTDAGADGEPLTGVGAERPKGEKSVEPVENGEQGKKQETSPRAGERENSREHEGFRHDPGGSWLYKVRSLFRDTRNKGVGGRGMVG
ncbi:hypothetical protein NDU88_002943 [Pleurodeles waltl]|uniref:Uncharacterized protein n=1 Tax=Pleurodeles waltl TaxID=8319 RepID=A0AAV7QE45_PLEWA|nr:hypothetical protein NDU88_002943 [Pleurodeles waltl]